LQTKRVDSTCMYTTDPNLGDSVTSLLKNIPFYCCLV
jgi:hypothetical protein